MPPSPYRLRWLEMAERQYLDLPDDTRALVEERLAQLESDPASLPDAAAALYASPGAGTGPTP